MVGPSFRSTQRRTPYVQLRASEYWQWVLSLGTADCIDSLRTQKEGGALNRTQATQASLGTIKAEMLNSILGVNDMRIYA
jgi:hypothetical protein